MPRWNGAGSDAGHLDAEQIMEAEVLELFKGMTEIETMLTLAEIADLRTALERIEKDSAVPGTMGAAKTGVSRGTARSLKCARVGCWVSTDRSNKTARLCSGVPFPGFEDEDPLMTTLASHFKDVRCRDRHPTV